MRAFFRSTRIVGETSEGYLHGILGRHNAPEDVVSAIRNAKNGRVDEGTVGAGTGTVAFGWKGGIGTASRRLPVTLGGYTIGVLVQSNFGGILTIGAPVGQEFDQYDLRTTRKTEVVTNDALSPLFEATVEATEEAIYNSMLKATTVTGNGHTVEALPKELRYFCTPTTAI
jgi:L-aminopeptidase/D-esterase-like protein